MFIRIGSILVFPHAVLLPFAGLFFAVVGWRRLNPSVVASRADTARAVGLASLMALAGAVVQATGGRFWLALFSMHDALPALGSFGAYWGALAGACIWARLHDCNAASAANALAPAVLAGGAVARIACIFTGCCRGIETEFIGLRPFYLWPVYDLAALLLVLCLGLYLESRRKTAAGHASLLAFLLVYPALRFSIEFVRAAPAELWWLTSGQALALFQSLFGLMLLARLRAARQSALD